MNIIEDIKDWLERREQQRHLREQGELAFRRGLDLNPDDDIYFQKGWFKAQRDELETERLKERQKRRIIQTKSEVEISRANARRPVPKKGKEQSDDVMPFFRGGVQ